MAKNSRKDQTQAQVVTAENQAHEQELESIINDAIATPISQTTTSASTSVITNEEVNKIIKRLGDIFGLQPMTAFVAVAMLFLKGAANKGAPSQMRVDVLDHEGTVVTVQKHDVAQVYSAVTGNNFLRRLAEKLSTQISRFAEAHKLQGDLAQSIETALIAQEEEPLTLKEKAWASSFCQKNPLLSQEAPRVARYLAIDYQKRFSKRKKTDSTKGTAKTSNKAKAAKKEVKKEGKNEK